MRKKRSYRADRLVKDIERTLASTILMEVSDVRIQEAGVSITNLQVSPDFSHAKVYVSMMNEKMTANDISEVLRILQDSAGFFRSVLSKNLETRSVPALRFFYDDFLEEMREIDRSVTQEKIELEKIIGRSLEEENGSANESTILAE